MSCLNRLDDVAVLIADGDTALRSGLCFSKVGHRRCNLAERRCGLGKAVAQDIVRRRFWWFMLWCPDARIENGPNLRTVTKPFVVVTIRRERGFPRFDMLRRVSECACRGLTNHLQRRTGWTFVFV